MAAPDHAALLRSLELFARHPPERLAALAARLEPLSLGDGQALFAEGEAGDALYFVSSGRVRVAKRLASGGEKDLASLGAGDVLGEMALLEPVRRSASAYASGDAVVLRLKRGDLEAWLKSDSSLAVDFLAGLLQSQSARLRRTSGEVALLYELSRLLLERASDEKALLGRALDLAISHLEGEWSADARTYNPFNEEMDPAAARGAEGFGPEAEKVPSMSAPESAWTDDRTLTLTLLGPRRPLAALRFRAAAPLDDARRAETRRTLEAVGRLLDAALENLDFRRDEALRERLKSRAPHGPRL